MRVRTATEADILVTWQFSASLLKLHKVCIVRFDRIEAKSAVLGEASVRRGKFPRYFPDHVQFATGFLAYAVAFYI